jgi:hypothetical protein
MIMHSGNLDLAIGRADVRTNIKDLSRGPLYMAGSNWPMGQCTLSARARETAGEARILYQAAEYPDASDVQVKGESRVWPP